MINNLVSLNKKIMTIAPEKLVEILNKFTIIKGIEIFIDCKSEFEMNYLDKLIKEIKKNKLILQIHCDVEETLNNQIRYLTKINEYAEYLNQKIILTFHSVYDSNIDMSIKKTKKYMETIMEQLGNSNFVFCLENLNILDGVKRLKKEQLHQILKENEKIYLTYDMGHELVDLGYINYNDSSEELIEKIRNVHIHECGKDGHDHLPIYKESQNFETIVQGICFLISQGYQYNLVYEYDLYLCKGSNIEEKIIDYLESIESVMVEVKNNIR